MSPRCFLVPNNYCLLKQLWPGHRSSVEAFIRHKWRSSEPLREMVFLLLRSLTLCLVKFHPRSFPLLVGKIADSSLVSVVTSLLKFLGAPEEQVRDLSALGTSRLYQSPSFP